LSQPPATPLGRNSPTSAYNPIGSPLCFAQIGTAADDQTRFHPHRPIPQECSHRSQWCQRRLNVGVKSVESRNAVTFPVDSACSKRACNLYAFRPARTTTAEGIAALARQTPFMRWSEFRDELSLRGNVRPRLAVAASQILHATTEDEPAAVPAARRYERSIEDVPVVAELR
jgi:hypothetical protein